MLIAHTFDTTRLFGRAAGPRLPAAAEPIASTAATAADSEQATPTVHRRWRLGRAAAACGSAVALLLGVAGWTATNAERDR